MSNDIAIKVEGLKKQYQLGVIGGTTLSRELESWWAKKRGKEDPNTIVGQNTGHYGDKFWALNDINLEIKKGEAVGIIGSNGAGKSTLLKILSRVTAPTEGVVKMKGRISSMLEVGTGFHPELTGRENIYMNGAILGMTKQEITEKMDEIIEFSECAQFIDTPVKRYSSGMYVKLAFAVAAHLDAEILIMDEVLAVGDVKFQKKCLGKMGDAAGQEGKTVLYVSHNMATIRQLCTRCIVLSHGTVIFDGDVEEAIAIYAETEKSSLPVFYDFTDVKRPSADHGSSLFVHCLNFEDRELASFSSSEKIKFSFEYTCHRNNEEIAVYFTLESADGSIIGTTFSDILQVTEEGKRKKITLEMDAANLIPGDYAFYLDVYYTNEFGSVYSCDHPMKKVFFEIKDDGKNQGFNWVKKYHGNVKLNTLKLVE